MSLFFETSSQANCFLHLLPLGLCMAFCLDASAISGKIRPLMDVLVLVLAGSAVLWWMVLLDENKLRLYHVLGMLTGMLLYMRSIGKIIRTIRQKQDLKRRMKKEYKLQRKG